MATDRQCYLEEAPISVRGAGFTPGAPLVISRHGVVIAAARADDAGTVEASVTAGRIPAGVAERDTELTVGDGTVSATHRFRVTRFAASYAPRAASPRSFVRFSAFGFGSGETVHVHYLRPDGSAARSVRLGPGRGPCGSIRRTKPRRLFPFRPAPGRWRLQFDTRRAVDPAAVPRLVLPVDVG